MSLFKKMFDQTREGKGVLKSELSEKFTLAKFFKLLGRKFWRIAGLNLLFVASNFPVIFFILRFAGYGSVPHQTPLSYWFGPIYGASQFQNNPAMSVLMSLCGITVDVDYPGTLSTVFLILGFLTFLTFGLSNAGMAYVLRNYVREEPVELVGDYFRTMKKNFWQALTFGVIDAFLVFMTGWNILLMLTGQGGAAIMTVLGTAACCVYLIMRSYIYVMMITFELSIPKLIKNALIFVYANIKRNLVGFIGCLLCYIITLALLMFVTPFGALALLALLFSVTAFIGIYAAYPAIKQYMIDPIIGEERKKRKTEAEEKASIFNDVG